MKTQTRKHQHQSPPATPGGAEPLLSGWMAAAIYFGLALLYFFPAFLPDRQIFGTDWLVGGYFFHEFISERFAAGELPKWVPYVFGGLPLFANPGSTYYPFRFLADFLFPVSKIWPTLFVIQFGFAGLGTYLLTRELGTRRWVALIAGLAFQFTGLTMSWVFAGHEGRIIVATFAPLTFFFFHRGIRTGSLPMFAGAAATVGLALLSFQIQLSYYLLLAAALWSAFCLWHLGVWRERSAFAQRVVLGLGAVAFAFALAAVNFLPFLDYIEQSPRGGEGGRGYEYSISYSMPPAEIISIAVPEQFGTSVAGEAGEYPLNRYEGENGIKLHTEYMGAVVIALVALGFAYSRRNRYWLFFLALTVFALTISFGGHTPIYRLYYELLPGTKQFRAPSVSFFLVSMSLVVMAALALESLAQRFGSRAVTARSGAGQPGQQADFSVGGWILGGLAALVFLAGAVASGGASSGYFRFGIFLAAAGAVLWFWMKGQLSVRMTVILLAVITVVDLWIVDRNFFDTVPPPDVLYAADDVADFLRSQPGRDRVWVFPAGAVYRGATGNYLMHFDIDQAGGEHGNHIQRWGEYVGAGEQTYIDWQNFIQYPVFLHAANIRYLVAGVELQSPLLREVYRGSALVYENPLALPRAYLVGNVVVTDEPDGALELMKRPGFDPRTTAVVNSEEPLPLPATPLESSAELVEYTPDRVVVRTEQNREALLVLADNFYKGWVAEVDGEEVPILRTNHALRGVTVGPGAHEVVFTYRPEDLYRGLAVYLVGLALLAGYGIFLLIRYLRRRRLSASPA